jgi:phage terminase small subunit
MGQKSSKRAEIFAREYVIDLNGTRAAIAAGYSERTAAEQASRLLNKVKTRKIIDQLQAKRASKLDLKAEHIAEELRRMAFSNMMDYMEIDEEGKPTGLNLSRLTRDQAAAIQEITEDTTGGTGDGERRMILRTKFKLADKRGSLELLGRHLGMFQDNLKVTGLEGLAERINKLRVSKHASS